MAVIAKKRVTMVRDNLNSFYTYLLRWSSDAQEDEKHSKESNDVTIRWTDSMSDEEKADATGMFPTCNWFFSNDIPQPRARKSYPISCVQEKQSPSNIGV
jgi:hypothetical protein